MNALEQMSKFYDYINLYPSMVQMYNKKGNLPRLNLIYTNMTPQQTIQRFDFDYCRCYWTPAGGVEFGTGCKESIQTRVIRSPGSLRRMTRKRILKAINYGYVFEKNFWVEFPDLLKNRNKVPRADQQDDRFPYPIKPSDLDSDKFKMFEVNFRLTNIKMVNQTLEELSSQFQKIAGMKNVKLPVLIKFGKEDFQLLKRYIKSIVLKNPLSDAHYFQIKIGTNFISCFPNKQYDQEQLSYSFPKMAKSEESHSENEQQTVHEGNTKLIIGNESQKNVIQLNQSGSAYITIDHLPQKLKKLGIEKFSEMWHLHPKQKHKIIMFEKQVEVSRYSRSYMNTPTDLSHTKGRSYMYSGYNTTKNKQDLPIQFKPFYDQIKKKDKRYNQVIANWYTDENDYIADHSDCQKGMIENASVSIVSLYEREDENGYRYMEIKPKTGTKALSMKVVVRLDHGLILTMHGTTQDEFKHGVRKEDKPVSSRISLSFRQMIS